MILKSEESRGNTLGPNPDSDQGDGEGLFFPKKKQMNRLNSNV